MTTTTTRKSFTYRVVSVLLALCIAAGLLPRYSARALGLEEGNFNPNTGLISINFETQYTQMLSIEILIEGKHFGWLLKDTELTGTAGPLQPGDPCAVYDTHTPTNDPNSAGTATLGTEAGSGTEVWVEQQEGESPGHHTLYWTGSINGKPILAAAPDKDKYTVTLSFQGRGYPERGKTACSDPDNGVHNGEDWVWTQREDYVKETDVEINYSTILLALSGLSDLQLANNGNLSYEMILEQIGYLSNWVDFEWLANNYDSLSLELDPEEIDPVNMIDGSFTFSYTDLRLEGRFPLSFSRAYNSRGRGNSLGDGFTHSFDYSLTNEHGFVHVGLPGGEEFIFLKLRDFEANDYYTVQNREFELRDTSSGGYIMEYKRGAQYEFDAAGHLFEIRNESGLAMYTLTYSGDELSRVTGVAGYLDFAWAGGHIISVADSAGRSVAYVYNGDNLVTVTNPDGDTLTYGYDGNGYLDSAKDFEGDEYVRNTYDGVGRVTEQVFINADVVTTHNISYDDANLVNTYTNPQGRRTEYHYDEYRHLLYTVDEDGTTASQFTNYIASQLKDKQNNTTSFGVDGRGNITVATYANGNVVNYEYTGNLISKISYADGSYEAYGYTNSRVTSYRDRRGNTTNYVYDGLGLLTSETNALGFTTSYAYDVNGRLVSVTDAEGGVTSYGYDAVGRITSATVKVNNSDNAVTQYFYSPAGKLLKVIDALNNVTEYEYNGNGFTTKTTRLNPGDSDFVASTEYGTNGQPLRDIDANGNETVYAYEPGTGLLKTITDPEGNTTTYFYDNDGRTTSVQDAEGHSTTYAYDSLGRLEVLTDALGGKTTYTYDAMGRTKTVTDANTHTTQYEYDLFGRVTKTIDAAGNPTIYSYDPNGNLLSTKDANDITTTTVYNELNYSVKTVDGEGNATDYAYDRVGRLKTVTSHLGGTAVVTSYTYDLAGNMLTSTDPNGNTTRYTYDLLGRTTVQLNADATSKSYWYDVMGRVTESYNELGKPTL